MAGVVYSIKVGFEADPDPVQRMVRPALVLGMNVVGVMPAVGDARGFTPRGADAPVAAGDVRGPHGRPERLQIGVRTGRLVDIRAVRLDFPCGP
jgi:hypothetical protein